MNILICDDHAILREGLRSVLETLDANLVEAATGEEALARVAVGDVDIVLLDLGLPGVDGWDVLGELRSNYPAVPVIIISASEGPDEVHRALESGASGFIPKSSAPGVLRAALHLVLSGGGLYPARGARGTRCCPRPQPRSNAESTPTAARGGCAAHAAPSRGPQHDCARPHEP